MTFRTLAEGAVAVLGTAAPEAKARMSLDVAEAWRSGRLAQPGRCPPPARPARPPRPELRAPRHMPKRGRAGSPAGRIALLHALAHIEFNAVDLAWDLIARFAADIPSRAFADDWVTVAQEESVHFTLLTRRLSDLGAAYGDLPAHDGLWQAAEATADDVLARLAIVPLVLEARGLDVTPAIIASLQKAGDDDSARVLERIYQDEIGHVATGMRWFRHVCAERGLAPGATWRSLVRERFNGALKAPFNQSARAAAGFAIGFGYDTISD